MTFTDDYYSVHRLRDGQDVRLRLLRRGDRELLLAGFDALSPDSRYRRFFTAMPRLPDGFVHHLLDVDGSNRVAIVVEDASDGEPLGIARFFRLDDTPGAAEMAIVVVDHAQHHGLGEILLTALGEAARERGIVKFRADVLRTNTAMTTLLRKVYAGVKTVSTDGSVVVYEMTLELPHGPSTPTAL